LGGGTLGSVIDSTGHNTNLVLVTIDKTISLSPIYN